MGKELNDWMARTANFAVLVACVLTVILGVSLWLMSLDRDPPFRILPHDPVTIRAGTHAVVDVPVWRDYSRTCDVEYDRYLFDGSGWRFDLVTGAHMSDATIRSLPKDRLAIKLLVPPPHSVENQGGIVLGNGFIRAPLRYYCNKGHSFLFHPILVDTEIPIVLVP
jgi:hypothetical protein